MHRLDCDEYVDMGEHNKPLCKKNGYRPAECELCPTRVAALEAENERLWRALAESCCRLSAANEADGGGFVDDGYCELLRELGIEVL